MLSLYACSSFVVLLVINKLKLRWKIGRAGEERKQRKDYIVNLINVSLLRAGLYRSISSWNLRCQYIDKHRAVSREGQHSELGKFPEHNRPRICNSWCCRGQVREAQ